MSSGDERDDESSRLGFAQTVTPVAGVPVVAGPTPPVNHQTQASQLDIDRPDADKLQRAVAKQRVAGKLFAKKAEAVKLGRYHLLETVGSGGMGVVWGAWDPELDRRVAIKLVKAEMQAARDRILIEGQALAKLSHPNVIPIYDVGVVDEQVYLVMEWVRGKNLRAWLKQPRTVRDVVAVYRASGEGLSAAHRVGLIHRDFKPDNAMIGDDGRVRVLDFGLARGEVKAKSKPKATDDDRESLEQFSSDLTRGAGTPRYMPPEQAEGDELSPAVDQYALGVSLREALVGRNADGKDADVPRWLNDIIVRATARDATNRYPSMDALLYELTHDPRTVWRRRGIVAGALALAGATFVVGSVRGGSTKVEKCGGGADAIAATWQPKIRDAMTTHLQTLGPYGVEEAKRLVGDMNAYGTKWAGMHRGLCLAHERKESTPQLYEIRLGCLSRAQAAFDTVVKVLTRVETERLPNAILAARALPDVDPCRLETTSSMIEPPADAIKPQVAALSNKVEEVRFLALAWDPTAKSVATAAAASADQLGYQPLVAKAQLALGLATIGDGQDAAKAIPILERAHTTGLAAGDFVTFVEAYAREVYAAAITPPPERPKEMTNFDATSQFAVNVAKATRDEGVFARTLLYNNLGTARLSNGDVDGARTWFDTAMAETQSGKRNIEFWQILGNAALTAKDRVRREALFKEEREQLEREFGPNHAFTLDGVMRAALFVENGNDVFTQLRDACNGMQKWHPHRKGRIDDCTFELASIALERGDEAEARRAAQLFEGADPPERKGIMNGYTLLLDGKLDQAASDMRALGDKLASSELWYIRFLAIDAYFIAVNSDMKAKRTAAAILSLQKMLKVLDSPDFNKTATYYTRRLARGHALAAKLLPPSEARVHAKTAADWYRAAGGYDALVAELDAITGSR